MSRFTLRRNSCAVNAPVPGVTPGAHCDVLLPPWFPLPLDDLGEIADHGSQYSA
jgi:hypothetical protein